MAHARAQRLDLEIVMTTTREIRAARHPSLVKENYSEKQALATDLTTEIIFHSLQMELL